MSGVKSTQHDVYKGYYLSHISCKHIKTKSEEKRATPHYVWAFAYDGGGQEQIRFRRKWRQTNRKKEMNDVCEGVWYSNIFDLNMIFEKTYNFKRAVQLSNT